MLIVIYSRDTWYCNSIHLPTPPLQKRSVIDPVLLLNCNKHPAIYCLKIKASVVQLKA